jgi:hypothetical protein
LCDIASVGGATGDPRWRGNITAPIYLIGTLAKVSQFIFNDIAVWQSTSRAKRTAFKINISIRRSVGGDKILSLVCQSLVVASIESKGLGASTREPARFLGEPAG